MLKTPATPVLRRAGALAVLMLCCIALPAHAQWKWKDAAGKTQYSDLPPPNGTPEKDILQRPAGMKQPLQIVPFGASAPVAASAPARAASGPSKAELDSQAKQKQQEQEQLAKQKEDERRVAQQRRENCSRAQDNMKMLDSGIRITRPNERGEAVILDERQRAEEVQRTRNLIGSECR